MPLRRAFISHIADEAATAKSLKKALKRDFLGMMDVFVSSDEESIAAGDAWLDSVGRALQQANIMLILCSPESIRRPWVNFEAGAAWMREIPIIPLCHAGLRPGDLPMPLSSRHGIALATEDGLQRLYARVAAVLDCDVPKTDLGNLAHVIATTASAAIIPSAASDALERERAIRDRLEASLKDSRFKWRSLERVALEAGVSEELAADYLRGASTVRFSKSKSGKVIVGLAEGIGAQSK